MKTKNALIIMALALLNVGLHAQTTVNKAKLHELSELFRQQGIDRKAEAAEYAVNHGIQIRQVLPDGNILALQLIDNGRPVFFETQNINAAITARVDQLWTGGSLGLNLDGSTYDGLALWDAGGVRASHLEFISGEVSRVSQMDAPLDIYNDHSTHVAGTMVASGFDPAAKGMAYNANLKAWDWDGDTDEIPLAVSDNGIEISNHSYGYAHGWSNNVWVGDKKVNRKEDYWFGFYSTFSMELDMIAHAAPEYLYVKSAGNDRDDDGDGPFPPDGNQGTGYDCIGTRASAKNILTVGAVDDMSFYDGPSSVIMTAYSSWGPVDDGRIKPDIVANGHNVYSTIASVNNQDYAIYDGTSMATASTSGALALLQEHYRNTHGTSMLAATLKALVIHTADEAGPAPGPDYMFGWGLLNARAAAEKISEDESAISPVIEELILNNAGIVTREIVLDNPQSLMVTICWTDPAGTPVDPTLDPLDPMLVNDLDLSIIGASETYFPWKLDRDDPDTPATNAGENNVDNVETVFVASAPAGTYTIQIDHDGTLDAPQAFSMIVTVGSAVAPQYCDSHGNASSEWISGAAIADDTRTSDNSGIDGYQDFTNDPPFELNANTDYPIILTPGFGGKPGFEYWSVWIDFDDSKSFDEGELVLSTGKTKTVVNDIITIPDMATMQTRMRVAMSRSGLTLPCDIFEFGEVEDYAVQITGTPPPTEYCIPEVTDFSSDWIGSVSIGNFSNITDGAPSAGYTFFTAPQADISGGVDIPITLVPDFFKKTERQYWRVWIDYNNDLEFTADELIFSADNIRGTATGNINVTVAIQTTTRMRVTMSRGAAGNPCGPIDFGEVEDYIVNLTPGIPGTSKSGSLDEEITLSPPELTVFPNPVDNILNISFTGDIDNTDIMIYNIQGSIVRNQKLRSSHTALDTRDLTPGIYFLALKTDIKTIYKKIVKQ